MKICLLTRSLALKGGGIGRVSSELMKGLIKRGHSVHTISTNKESLPSYFKYTFLDMPFRIPKGFDIYHAVTSPMESIWIPKDKGVVTILDIIPVTNPEMHGARMGGNKVKYTVGKYCFTVGCKQAARCKRVVCISEHTKQELIKHFGVEESRVKVIRLGIRDDLRPLNKRNGKFRIGYLGQLDKRKRLDLLINAFKESSLDAELVIGGRGYDEAYFKVLAGLDSRIKFPGFVKDDELVDFYNSLDVLVFPSAIEGYGLPPVEAMACKKPVIVLNNAIIPWEVKSRCVIVEDLEFVLGSKSCLEGLLKSIDYDGNYRFAKEHSWDKCIDEYIELYKEVLGK